MSGSDHFVAFTSCPEKHTKVTGLANVGTSTLRVVRSSSRRQSEGCKKTKKRLFGFRSHCSLVSYLFLCLLFVIVTKFSL